MAFSESPRLRSAKAATTVSSTALYRIAWVYEDGVIVGDPGSTSVAAKLAGICYGYSRSTSTDRGTIPIAYGGIAKVACEASTVTAGELLGASSNGWGCTPTTNMYVIGRQIAGTSGGAGMVRSVLLSIESPVVYSARIGLGSS